MGEGVTRQICKDALRQYRKRILECYRTPMYWNPLPRSWNLFLDLGKAWLGAVLGFVTYLFMAPAILIAICTMPAWVPIWTIYKTIRRIYYRWWNVRFCRKCGGVFKMHDKLS